jgi:hypothetical protein
VSVSSGGHSQCNFALSEGTGHVAAMLEIGRLESSWQVFGPDGTAEQKMIVEADVWPQPEGWQALIPGVPGSLTFETFFADGTPRRTEQATPTTFRLGAWYFAPDPLGGAVAALSGLDSSGTCVAELHRLDATGAHRSARPQRSRRTTSVRVSSSTSSGACEWRFWPGLLGGG